MSQSNLSRYVAKRVNPTGQARTRKLKLFNTNGKVNQKLLKQLDANPLSYKLPKEYVYINDYNKIEPATDWLVSIDGRNRELRTTWEDEYQLVGNNYIQTRWGQEQVVDNISFNGLIATYNSPIKTKLGDDSIGTEVLNRFKSKFKNRIRIHNGIRFQFSFELVFKTSRGVELPPFWMSVDSETMSDIRTFPRVIKEAVAAMKDKIVKTEQKGSGLIFIRAQHVAANVLKYNPTRGGTFIPTPPKLKNAKYGLINVENKKKDNHCFKDAILACIHYGDLKTKSQRNHRGRATTYKEWETELDTSMLTFPVDSRSREIDAFEKKNNISLNIYQYSNGQVYILKQTVLTPTDPNEPTTRRFANLLMISNKDDTVHHYLAATNMSALLCKQIGRHNSKSYPCQYCLHNYTTEAAFKKHQQYCSKHEAIKTEMPEPGSQMKFKNYFHQVKGRGVIYADFESFNMKISNCMPNTKSFTEKIAEQTPNSYFLLGKCANGKEFTRLYNIKQGETRNDFMRKFFDDLTEVEGLMRKQFNKKADMKHMIMSKVEKGEHDQCSKCYLCKADFCYDIKDVKLTDEEVVKLREKCKKEKKTEKQIKVEISKLKIQRRDELKKVRDHDHCTGKYIGAACNKCNINRNDQFFKIPVIMHNLQGYDSKFIIKEAVEMTKRFMVTKRAKLEPEIKQAEHDLKKVGVEIAHLIDIDDNDENYIESLRKREFELLKKVMNYNRRLTKLPRVQVIPLNSEKYLSFQCGGLRFLDSMSFMAESLDTLSGNLADKDKKLTKRFFKKKYKGKDIDLLMRKGVYPYSWVDSTVKFHQTSLPDQNDFYNDIGECECTDEQYKQAQLVWDEFDCKTFEDYSNLYLETDVYLLADVYEKFRDLMLKTHKLDPVYYFSLPQLSFDAALKLTEIELDLLSDKDMHLMNEEGIHGGVSFISHRKAVANNKYMKDYDKSKPSKYIMYFDLNNLYGGEMMKALPYKDFKWGDPTKYKISEDHEKNLKMIEKLIACKDPDKDHNGYTMEVDVRYDPRLHDLHNAYPCLPESMNIEKRCYSEYHKSCFSTCESCLKGKERKENCNQCIPISKCKKLIPTLRNKKNYILDIRLLYSAMKQGLELTKIHRVIKYTQKAWLKPYINLNSELRAQAKNDFEKDFYKLLNNAIFGKCMENLRNRMDFEIITDEERMEKSLRNPRLKMPVHQFGEDCVGVEYTKKKIKLCKPLYIGLSVLCLSKATMYDFHYNRMIKAYGDKLRMLFTDTDSFAYEIQTDDIYKDMLERKEFKVGTDNTVFDTSNYPKDHPLFSERNKKVPLFVKDEASGKIITVFVGLRSKMYSYETLTPDKNGQFHKKTHKGIKKKLDIPHSEYEECLVSQKANYKSWNCMRSKKHEMFVVKLKKKALSAFDDKSYILDDGISSLKWGHKDIPPEKNISGSCNNAE